MIGRAIGCVTRTAGTLIVGTIPGIAVGDGVCVRRGTRAIVGGEVVAIDGARATIAPFAPLHGIAVGDELEYDPTAAASCVGFALFGRVVDPEGMPLDGRNPPEWRRATPKVLDVAGRLPVDRPFWTGIRAIDGLLTIGRGARVGIFGAPGAGKTTLVDTIVAAAEADAIVVGLVGERGREAQTWVDRASPRTTVIAATSDRAPAERARAAQAAMAQAEYLRDRGLNVLLVVDSLARFAAALREQRVLLGEAVGRGGYPASIWADLARYVERAGPATRGSITLIATVLSDGGDEREPLSDAARSLLDGHIVLSTTLAHAGHFPAIDILASASRTMDAVVSKKHAADARAVRALLTRLAETADARALGLIDRDDPRLAHAIEREAAITAFCRQTDPSPGARTPTLLGDLLR